MGKRVSFITLGCAKNEVDTAHMTARLTDAGYIVIPEEEFLAAPEPVDALIINTCAFLQEAIEESIDTIFDMADLPFVVSGETKLVVAGCLSSRFGDELASSLEEADLFVACKQEADIVHDLNDLLGAASDTECTSSDPRSTRVCDQPSAYVKISDGCDRFCSFCAIPFIRGRYHSFTFDQINAEVHHLVQQGVKEVVLIAQDTGMWGSDLDPVSDVAELLDRLAQAYPSTWFRIMYLEPEHITDKFLNVMAAHSNICNYLDIPFQHCDHEIIASMNRKGSRKEFEELLERIRAALPEVALRTTLIVGYPGETDEQFDELCDFVSEADFDYVGVFAFSPEEGTKAAELPDQIDDETKQMRLRTIRDIADTISSSRLARFIGSSLEVLVVGQEEDGQLIGRSQFQAPEVDGVTYIDKGTPGEIVPVRIEDTLYYEMEGVCER